LGGLAARAANNISSDEQIITATEMLHTTVHPRHSFPHHIAKAEGIASPLIFSMVSASDITEITIGFEHCAH
jgi:hypothetical protein